jgi:putative FmdB family regulatory protein
MPFYDYRCASCARTFTARRSVNDRRAAPCETCGGDAGKLFLPSGRFFISAFEAPSRKSSDELALGRFHHGQPYVQRHDPNEPYRQEAKADAEARVVKDDATRDQAGARFDRSFAYLSGPARAAARKSMERDLDRQGVRR